MPLDNLQAHMARRSLDEYSASVFAPRPRRAEEWVTAETITLPPITDTIIELVRWGL